MTDNRSEFVLDTFRVQGLDEHNRSLDWIVETAEKLGATITTASEGRWTRFSESFEIRLNGRDSGIMYRISVSQSEKQTRFIAKRFDEIELTPKNSHIIMHAFPEIMHYDVHWYDLRISDWRGICMSDVENHSMPHWPGDGIVSVMYALNDDLRSCLNKEMRTLRKEMTEAFVTYWFAGLTPDKYPFNYTINQICEYLDHLILLEDTPVEDVFQDLVKKALGLSIFETAENNDANIGGMKI